MKRKKKISTIVKKEAKNINDYRDESIGKITIPAIRDLDMCEIVMETDEETFEKVYEKLRSTGSLGKFCPDPSFYCDKEKLRDFFDESFNSAATRYIQYEYHLKHMTYMPIIEFSNYTPDKNPPLYECVDS